MEFGNENKGSVSFIADMVIIKCDNLYQERKDGLICNIVAAVKDDFKEFYEERKHLLKEIVIVDVSEKSDFFERKLTNITEVAGSDVFVFSWKDIERGFSFEKIMKMIEIEN